MHTLARLLALSLAATAAFAQYAPPPPARPWVGFANEKLRASDPYMAAWDIAANYRTRYESKLGAGFTDASSNWDFSKRPVDDNNNSYLLSRVMPRVGYTGQRIAFTVEGRASSSIGDERFNANAPGQALAENDSGMDVHQAFVYVGNHKEFPVSLKIGRQELSYGDQRLVGHFRWNNNARTFDALKVRWQNPLFGVDLFTGGLVYNDSRNLNKSNSQDHFSGAYFNFPTLLKNEIAEAYFLARNVERGIATDDWRGVPAPFRFPGAQDVYTAGLRVKSKPNAYDSWDYGFELMQQFGNRTAVFPATAPPPRSPRRASITAPTPSSGRRLHVDGEHAPAAPRLHLQLRLRRQERDRHEERHVPKPVSHEPSFLRLHGPEQPPEPARLPRRLHHQAHHHLDHCAGGPRALPRAHERFLV